MTSLAPLSEASLGKVPSDTLTGFSNTAFSNARHRGTAMTDQARSAAITIDGQEYPIDELSDEAKAQITNLRVTDQEIARLQQQLAIAQTARVAYANALQKELPNKH